MIASGIALFASGNRGGAGAHTLLGVIVVIGVIFQVLIGFTRNIISGFSEATKRSPDDHGPRLARMHIPCADDLMLFSSRWIFNWMHWTVGRSMVPLSCM